MELLVTEPIEQEEMVEKFWMLVWNKETGDCLNAIGSGTMIDEVVESFQQANPSYLVVHINLGTTPPNTFASLPYFEG